MAGHETNAHAGGPDHGSHYARAKQALETLAIRLVNEGQTRLPAEDHLAEAMGFSRPTVRSALLALQMEGKVVRRHGVGTLINRHALRVAANLAEDLPFLEVIERLGHEATLDIIGLTEEQLPDRVARRLELPERSSGIVIDRLFRASGRPAVLSRDYVPTTSLNAPAEDLTGEGSTFAFLRRWTQRTVRYSVAEIRAADAPERVAAALRIPVGSAVLVLDHLHIDDRDEAVGVTEAHVRDGLLDLAIVRTGSEL